MKLQRREFLRVLAASSAATMLQPEIKSMTVESESGDALLLDARRLSCSLEPSPLHLGGTRTTARGEETLRLMNFCLERLQREKTTGQETVERVLPVCGEFHFARCDPDFWEDGLSKMKACGLTTVATYLFWILHESEEGSFNWEGRRNLRRFVELSERQGLDVFLRVGPFVHGEMRNGGLPDWLYGKPFEVRSNDPGYLECVRRYFGEIGKQIRGLLWEEGGPITGIQLENEFMAASAPWEVATTREQPIEWIPKGTGGVEHMSTLKKIALESGLRAPIYTATAWDSPVPEGEFLPVYGGYGFEPWSLDPQTHRQKPSWTFLFRAAHASVLTNGKQSAATDAGQIPFACCELGGGMQCFYHDRFVLPPESVQATALVALGSGCSFLGYYMFHGGSNPAGERVFYGEYDVPRISYDFQAPIREFGQTADSYRALRLGHLFLGAWGERLTSMQTVLPQGAEQMKPEDGGVARCALRTDGRESFLFVNNYQDHVQLPARRDIRFRVEFDKEQVAFPSRQGLSIAAGESAVFPLNVRLGGLTLAWATVQLVTELVHEGVRHVVLFVPRGVEAEIALVADGTSACKVQGGSLVRDGAHWIARGRAEDFYVECKAGDESIRLAVLPREAALHLSRHRLWGADRLVFTEADAAEHNEQLMLWSSVTSVEALVYPPPQGAAAVRSSLLPGACRLQANTSPWKGGVSWESIAANVYRIRVGVHALDDVDNILLRIQYVGDIGHLFLHGALVADHFANGAPWEIGLRQLHLHGKEAELILKVLPRNTETQVYLDETVPHPERFACRQVASIDSIEAIPVYRFLFDKPEGR